MMNKKTTKNRVDQGTFLDKTKCHISLLLSLVKNFPSLRNGSKFTTIFSIWVGKSRKEWKSNEGEGNGGRGTGGEGREKTPPLHRFFPNLRRPPAMQASIWVTNYNGLRWPSELGCQLEYYNPCLWSSHIWIFADFQCFFGLCALKSKQKTDSYMETCWGRNVLMSLGCKEKNRIMNKNKNNSAQNGNHYKTMFNNNNIIYREIAHLYKRLLLANSLTQQRWEKKKRKTLLRSILTHYDTHRAAWNAQSWVVTQVLEYANGSSIDKRHCWGNYFNSKTKARRNILFKFFKTF